MHYRQRQREEKRKEKAKEEERGGEKRKEVCYVLGIRNISKETKTPKQLGVKSYKLDRT